MTVSKIQKAAEKALAGAPPDADLSAVIALELVRDLCKILAYDASWNRSRKHKGRKGRLPNA